MAIINQYKATYPIANTSFQTNEVYVNATSMEKAVSLLNLRYENEPNIISKLRDNVLTEVTSETTVNFQIKSYYIDEDTQEEIEIPECVAYPTIISNAVRGNTVYMSAPNYQFTEIVNEEITRTYTFEKWIYDNEEYTNNPQEFVIPLDESVTTVTMKAIYTRI